MLEAYTFLYTLKLNYTFNKVESFTTDIAFFLHCVTCILIVFKRYFRYMDVQLSLVQTTVTTPRYYEPYNIYQLWEK